MPDPLSSRSGLGTPRAARPRDSRWLEPVDDRNVEERMARLEGDRALLEALQEAGYQGRNWTYFQTVLATYGIAVLQAWMRDRLIFAKCTEKGHGGLPPLPRANAFDDPDVVLELAGETIAEALESFRRKVLLPGKWDHRRGATLRTYFIGHCLLHYPNVYRQWRAVELRSQPDLFIDDVFADRDVLERFMDFVDDPHKKAAEHDLVRRLLGAVHDERARRAFVMMALGYSQPEVATRLQTTTKAVERMLDRARRQARRAA